MSQNHKKVARRGSKPNPRKYLYLLMRIILVILQLLVIAAHSDKHAGAVVGSPIAAAAALEGSSSTARRSARGWDRCVRTSKLCARAVATNIDGGCRVRVQVNAVSRNRRRIPPRS